MAQNLEMLLSNLSAEGVRASAEGQKAAVALTEKEIVTGVRKGMFKPRLEVQRYALAQVRQVHFSENPHSDLLTVQFEGGASDLFLMFGPDQRRNVAQLVAALRASTANGVGADGH